MVKHWQQKHLMWWHFRCSFKRPIFLAVQVCSFYSRWVWNYHVLKWGGVAFQLLIPQSEDALTQWEGGSKHPFWSIWGGICWAELMGWSKFEATSHSCHAHLRRSLALQSSDEINLWQTGQRFYTKRMHLSANLAARNCNTQFAKPWPKGTRRTWGSGLFLVSNSKLSSVGIILCRK